jgi:hypothetical protein
VLSAFDFAQKIIQAKDIDEVIRMQTEIQFLSEQIKVLGETAANAAKTATKFATESNTI